MVHTSAFLAVASFTPSILAWSTHNLVGSGDKRRACFSESTSHRTYQSIFDGQNALSTSKVILYGMQDDKRKDLDEGEIYSNPFTAFLGTFLPGASSDLNKDASGGEDKSAELGPFLDLWDKPKREGLGMDQMIATLDLGLREREWFVTGNAMPELFADDFFFKDPDVQLKGIQKYCEGVRRLFDQEVSRAGIIDVRYNEELTNNADKGTNVITVEWRLSGKVNLGPLGLTIKPYICYSDLHVRQSNGLIFFQEDRFAIPGWDLLLSFFVPWLPILAPAAPPVEDIVKERERQS
jgi:hypothetical protein